MISRVAKSRDREKSEILISRRRKNRSLQHWAPTAHQCIIPDKRKKCIFHPSSIAEV
jgi:galactose-1-phosphate uridylyltransferase